MAETFISSQSNVTRYRCHHFLSDIWVYSIRQLRVWWWCMHLAYLRATFLMWYDQWDRQHELTDWIRSKFKHSHGKSISYNRSTIWLYALREGIVFLTHIRNWEKERNIVKIFWLDSKVYSMVEQYYILSITVWLLCFVRTHILLQSLLFFSSFRLVLFCGISKQVYPFSYVFRYPSIFAFPAKI